MARTALIHGRHFTGSETGSLFISTHDNLSDRHSRAIWRLSATAIVHYACNHYTGRPLRWLQWRATSPNKASL